MGQDMQEHDASLVKKMIAVRDPLVAVVATR